MGSSLEAVFLIWQPCSARGETDRMPWGVLTSLSRLWAWLQTKRAQSLLKAFRSGFSRAHLAASRVPTSLQLSIAVLVGLFIASALSASGLAVVIWWALRPVR